ncbi:MAG: RidA/YER057c/UK114 superfamily protein, partial [uncultured Rubrobacteraceae bacterium]
GHHPGEPRRTAGGRRLPPRVGRHRVEDGVRRGPGGLGRRREHGRRGRPRRPGRAVPPQRRRGPGCGRRHLRGPGETDHLRRRLGPREDARAHGRDFPGLRRAGRRPVPARHADRRGGTGRSRPPGRGRGHRSPRL